MKHVVKEAGATGLPATPVSGARPHASRTNRRQMNDDYVDLGPYVLAVVDKWRRIAVVALAAALITAAIAALAMPKWYRAKAIIHPVSAISLASRMSGLLGGLGGLSTSLSALAASLNRGSSAKAEEYITILRSFQFNISLAERHHLMGRLVEPGIVGFLDGEKSKDAHWAAYRVLQKRFSCEYSIKTGNITVYFEARNRREAETILGYYIDHLRALLRARQVRDTTLAIDSLEAEAASVSDPLLRVQLYELEARQIERKETAQVEADFSFRVLDPPAASDKPYSPRILLDSLLVAVLATLAMSGIVIVRCHKQRAD